MEGGLCRKNFRLQHRYKKVWRARMGVTTCSNGSALVLLLGLVIGWEQPVGSMDSVQIWCLIQRSSRWGCQSLSQLSVLG